MRQGLCFGTALVLFLVQGLFAWAGELNATQVADGIQKFYDSTRDYQAAFQQEYQSKAFGKKKKSSGFVYIKKPGMMRWDYKEPSPKYFVADGQALYLYHPDLEQVMVDRSFSGSDLSVAVTFLWGKGKLSDEFTISFSKRSDLGGPRHYVLEMTPKKKARFANLVFVVQKATFQVDETIMEDPGGNINHLFFADAATNVGLKDEAFHFEIPKGVEVIEAPKQ